LDNISTAALTELFLKDTPLIDVRAPVEFVVGSLPGAINLPIMNNEERAMVGTTYKQSGREQAMAQGHELVSGDIKEQRLTLWAEQIQKQPETVIYCFRGGLRSQITQRWLGERGIKRPLIEGGYKKARQFLRDEIDQFSRQSSMLILSGPTGSAKTNLLKKSNYPNVDLEALASHRGSAFGALATPQPSQIDFENTLAVTLMKLGKKQVLVEDESRLIGRCAIPESFFVKMRDSEILYVEEPFEQRVENIYQDYILGTAIGRGDELKATVKFADYRRAISLISKKLGGARAQELLQDLNDSEITKNLESNKVWIAKLLSYYYDPLYANSLERRSPKIILRGNSTAILDYLRSHT
jgi:tRNA 2-selenouridine synthase